MDIAQTGLQRQPFHAFGRPVVFAPYHAQLAAHHFLRAVLKDDRGVGVFYGPKSSGKTTIVNEFVQSLPEDTPVAVVDAARSKTLELLTAILVQFDPGPSFDSVDNCWYALRIFLAEKARTGHTPLLVVENINRMYPSALYTLCKLAELKLQGRYVVRMILMSDRVPFSVLHAPKMAPVARRSIAAFELGPMTRKEVTTYVHAKLRGGGCDNPGTLFPDEAIERLHAASGGWPGRIDALARQAIQRAEEMPISPELIDVPADSKPDETSAVAIPQTVEPPVLPKTASPPHISEPVAGDQAAAIEAGEPPTLRDAVYSPDRFVPAETHLKAVVEPIEDPGIQKLFLTLNRKTLREINLADSKVLIGRSELCDVPIDSRFVSKCHAILIRTDDALHLVDLNSKNGTFVNSERIESQVLRHDDVISIGNHGIKLICPAYRSRPDVQEQDLAETAAMRTLPELRRMRDEAGDDAVQATTRKS